MVCGVFPTTSFQAQTTSGDDAMQMIVVEQCLAPGMQHCGHSDLRVEVVAAKLQKRRGYTVEQQIVECCSILLNDPVEFMRQGEDQVEIGNGQEQFSLSVHPIKAVGTLATRTVSIAAGVGNKMLLPAMRALIKMSTQSRCAAGHDGTQNFPMMKWQRLFFSMARHARAKHFCQGEFWNACHLVLARLHAARSNLGAG